MGSSIFSLPWPFTQFYLHPPSSPLRENRRSCIIRTTPHPYPVYVPWGYAGVVQCDPIEKKPFFHAYPGALAYSFGMLGCDLHCSYCQNWLTSQALRDPKAVSEPMDVTPRQLVDVAQRQQASVVATSYNEPLITSEWAVEVFTEARPRGFMTANIPNGH